MFTGRKVQGGMGWGGGRRKVSLCTGTGRGAHHTGTEGSPCRALAAEGADPDLLGSGGWWLVIGRHCVTSDSHQLFNSASSAKHTAWPSSLSSSSPSPTPEWSGGGDWVHHTCDSRTSVRPTGTGAARRDVPPANTTGARTPGRSSCSCPALPEAPGNSLWPVGHVNASWDL